LYNWKASLNGVLAGALTGLALGLLGFFLSQGHHPNVMGPVVFLLVPFVVGFAIAMVARDMRSVTAAAILATIASLGMLIAFGREGLLCALMAIPLLFIGLAVGVTLGFLFNKLVAKFRGGSSSTTFMSVILLTMPLLILAGHRVEVATLVYPRREVVTSTIRLAADPSHVCS
jgi:hypothetical protein